MKLDKFVDTSGFYAFLVKRDSMHLRAVDMLQQAAQKKSSFVTTDYVIDETATLLQARGLSHKLPEFFNAIFESNACSIEWIKIASSKQKPTF